MRILITGASGVVGRILTNALAQTHSLILADIRKPNETDDESYLRIAARHAFAKVDVYERSAVQRLVKTFNPQAVVHLAAILGRETPWEDVLHFNLVGAINVLEISLSFRLERVIYASTNNIYGGYEEDAIRAGQPLHLQTSPQLLSEDVTPRPDSRYAVAKLMVEKYASYLSTRHGLRTFGLRIGTVRELDDPGQQATEPELIPRFRKTWLHHRDLVQLVELSLRSSRSYGIYNAISGRPGTPGVFIDIS
ncbi:MAG: NAD-dependent epimerase/dehydratase family protein, partial [Gammaproteobacteria bacterium]